MKKNILTSITMVALSIVIFTSCKKEVKVDNETQSVVDNAICEQQFMSIAPNVNNKGAGSPRNQGFKTASTCGSWLLLGNDTTSLHFASDTATNANGMYLNGPVNFAIDYGSGCTDIDGVTKQGQMKIKSTHKWSVVNTSTASITSTATVTFVNYIVDGVKYDGTVKLIKSGNGNGSSIRTVVSGGHCSNASWNIYYDCDKTLTKNSNGDFTIAGTSTGINRENRNFTVNILTPLFKPANYKFITSGTLELTPDGFKTRTVDFGNGSLDNQATFTVDGQTISFTMQ